jgi:hypothetical protein
VIVWWLELQLHVLSVPIITNVKRSVSNFETQMEKWWVEQSYVRFDINNKKAAFRQGECPYRHEQSTEGIISSLSWSYGGWNYNYMCYQCLSSLMSRVNIPLMAKCPRYNITQYSVSLTWYINNKKAAFRQGECPYRHEQSTEGIIYISSKFWQSL